MDNETLKTKVAELYESGLGYVKIAAELGLSRSKVRRLLEKDTGKRTNIFKPSKIHVPLELRLINILADTQMRVSIDQGTVEEYAEAIREGAEFPAVSVFTNGLMYWLADGFHRYYAAREADVETITADIYQGTLRDAQMYAIGANANHGLRRTNADKRHAVEVALTDDEWRELPNTEIAKMCGVAESFVRKIKSERDAAAQNSHNATPNTPSDSLDTKPEHQRETDTPPTSFPEKVDSPEPDMAAQSHENPPIQNDKGFYKWGITFYPKRKLLVVTNLQDLSTFIFKSKDEFEAFINALKDQLPLWDEQDDDKSEPITKLITMEAK